MRNEAQLEFTEHRFDFEGTRAAYYRGGAGPRLLLLHGSGPGASSRGNWRAVLQPLAQHFEVFALDLIGFGLSDRKPSAPFFDYPMWVRQAEAMLERVDGLGPVGVIGHSLSGSIALTLASRRSRVGAVMTTGTMGAPFEPNAATHRTWTCPTNREDLRAALQGLVFDRTVIDDAYLAAREPVLFAPGYAEYFNAMFEGDQRRYIEAAVLSRETLQRVACPVLMLHGRNDVPFPPSSTSQIAEALLQADVLLLARCSHSVAFEHPAKFMAAAVPFFNTHLAEAATRP